MRAPGLSPAKGGGTGKLEFVQAIGDVLHCVNPVPRSFAVPMARLEPVQTAWAMSKPPSMATDAREIVKDLILSGNNQTLLAGYSGDEK